VIGVVVAAVGWALALAAVLVLWRRLAAAADAKHELRGAATAIGLAVERLERGGSIADLGPLVRLQLARMGAALRDLGGPTPAEASLEAERLAQVLGNVVANAAEHGVGPVAVVARREGGVARLEVRNGQRARSGGKTDRPGRGRGIAIAARAARALGGQLRVESDGRVTRAVVELPVEESRPSDDRPSDARSEDARPGDTRRAA
jgi:C4-dicarboxylate-specific signal transduction histidine kinase